MDTHTAYKMYVLYGILIQRTDAMTTESHTPNIPPHQNLPKQVYDAVAPINMPPHHPLYKIHTGYGRAENLFNLIGGFIILAMVLMGGFQVLSRLFFNISVRGYIDIVEQMMIGFSFFGLAYCQRTDGHIRMDLVIKKVHGRTHWIMELITASLAGICLLLINIGAYKHFYRSFTNGDSSTDISIPLWYTKGFVAIMLVSVVIRLLIESWGYARLAINPTATPIATPAPESDDVHDFVDVNTPQGEKS